MHLFRKRLRLGVAAATTRGLDQTAMRTLGNAIADLIEAKAAGTLNSVVTTAKQSVAQICEQHPICSGN